MAKSSRASRTKTNRANLRARVFAPLDQARTERLSARLTELAAQPRPQRPEKMELDSKPETKDSKPLSDTNTTQAEGMDIDGDKSSAKRKGRRSNSRIQKNSITKTRRGKATSSITFPVYRRGKLVDDGRRKKRK